MERVIECAGHEIRVVRTMPQRWVVYLDGEFVLWACNYADAKKKVLDLANAYM